MNYISSNIKFLRLQKGLTQEDVANVVKKSRVLISQWESDSREITTEDIIKLSDYFDVPMDMLVGKDLRIEENKSFDEAEILYSKYKNVISDDDKEHIMFILNKYKRKIDEQLGDE